MAMRHRLRLGFISLLVCAAVTRAAAGAAGPALDRPGALILYDSATPYAWVGELHAIQVANLLGHFPLEWTIEPVEEYQAGAVDAHSVTFYIGDAFDNPLPPAFLSDVMSTERVICWFKYNLWQIAWDDNWWWNPAFTERFGFQFAGVDDSGFTEVHYKGESLTKDPADPDVGATVILDEGLAEVKAVAYRPATATTPEASWPYVVHARNLWYFADTPLTYISEEDRYLVFCDLLHDIVGIDHAPVHRALIRLEDVDPTSDAGDLSDIAGYLRSEGVPFQVSVIPVFRDPLGVLGGGVPSELALSQSRPVSKALRDMVKGGGQIFLHGYTHQYDATPNPYNGLTGDDCEFFLAQWNEELAETEILGPVPEDSAAWVNDRIDRGLAELSAVGLRPVAWETPHYIASALDSVEFGKRFAAVSGRVLYFSSLGPYCAGQFYPYVIERDVYGQKVLPENLGNVEPVPFYDYPVRLPEDILRAAQKNLVVRDGWASAYFHPYYDPEYLVDVVDGVRALGYTYVSVPTLVADAGPDKTTVAGAPVVLEGSASGGSAPYSYLWSPAAGLSDPTAARPTAVPSQTTAYTLTVVDARGEMDTDRVIVAVASPPIAEAGPDQEIAAGQSCLLAGAAWGGTPPYSFSWSPVEGINDPNVAQPTASPLTTTTYTLTVTDSLGYQSTDAATVVVHPEPHEVVVAASVSPDAVASAASAQLAATAQDTWGHEVAFRWSDGGAGGLFAPSALVQNPVYWAPANQTDADLVIEITVAASCGAEEPAEAADSVLLAVHPAPHALSVSASASPTVVDSRGSTTLSATAVDSREGHEIASWLWSDGGVGGSFSPSAFVQNPNYTAPANATDADLDVTLTVTATCNGPSPLAESADVILTVRPEAHTLSVAASVSPSTTDSGGTADLTAAATDSRGHTVSYAWSDGDAGGIFSPSPFAQSPTYTAPANRTGADVLVTLTVTATCDGPSPLSASNSVDLVVRPLAHVITVSASADPSTVASGGTTSLSASANDSYDGHDIARWSWSDGGAGGSFSPSAAVQNPEYTAPENRTGGPIAIQLTVSATCDGPEPTTGSATVYLTVRPTGMFSDVPADHWARVWIEACYNAGIVAGYEDGTYRPSLPVSRDQMAVYISRALAGGEANVPEPATAPHFADVPQDYWAYKYVEHLYAEGVVSGYADGYHPAEIVNRAQMAVFVARAMCKPVGEDGLTGYAPPSEPTFPDVPADFWAYRYIEYCHDRGIVSGYGDGYHPESEVTRDQMAVYVARAFGL